MEEEPEEVEEYLEETLPQEPMGYGEEYDEAAYDAPPLEEEEDYIVPEEAFELDTVTIQPQVKREKAKKQVRFNEWTEEFTPPEEAREEYFVPQELEAPPLPTPWSQQVEAAHNKLVQPSTWGQYQFHPEAMDMSARGRVHMMRELVVCHHCHQEGHIRPVCPNRHQPRARWPKVHPAEGPFQTSLFTPATSIPVVPPPKGPPPPPMGILKPQQMAAERVAQIIKELEENPELHEELNCNGTLKKFMEAEMIGHPKELRVLVTFVTTKGMLTISALVDSGATVNTIVPLLARRLGLEVQQYALPRPMLNADGTWSQSRVVREYTKLSVTANNHYAEMEFMLIDSAVDLLLGFPWLSHFEPQINWKAATLEDKYWPMLATSVRELAYNATVAARIPREESRAWGPCPRKEGDVMFQPCDTPATPPTHAGMLRYINHQYDMPNKDEIHLWTHRNDDEDDATVHAMLDTPEDAEEDLEDAEYLYKTVMSGPYD